MWKNIVELGRPQMKIWRMRIACRILKTTNTHSEYVTLIASPLQQRSQERPPPQYYVTHTPPDLFRFPQTQFYETVFFSRDTDRRVDRQRPQIDTIYYLLKMCPKRFDKLVSFARDTTIFPATACTPGFMKLKTTNNALCDSHARYSTPPSATPGLAQII